MPCHHKFQSYLNLERLDFEPTTLIVGTFNPEWPAANLATWFYGRITGGINDHNSGNHFWAVLPRIYGRDSMKIAANKQQWKAFCKENKIAITDLISTIVDADSNNNAHQQLLQGYSDTAIAENFNEFKFTDIVGLLEQHPSIRNVYLTRGTGQTFWNNLWQPVTAYCNLHRITCNTLMTPSDNVRFQLGPYNALHPEQKLNREDFIYMYWQQKWHLL